MAFLEVTSRNHKKELSELRKEANRLRSLANHRLQRLEKNGLQSTPAYQLYLKEGGKPFSIRGKNYNELQKEMRKMRNFINSKTSTVRGANKVLREMATNTGIKYKNLKELRAKSKKFFTLASKIDQYNQQIGMSAVLGYQPIWNAINEYVQQEKIDLEDIDETLDNYIQTIANMCVREETHTSFKEWTKKNKGKWIEM